jgi:pSer/pThr/pTyr-binding forkhead associated (FHA) protein
MFQLKILSGKMAGHLMVARRFPFLIGRQANADLILEEPGVWERHARIEFISGEGFRMNADGTALVIINGTAQTSALLRNGDVLELGGVKLQFWLNDPRQSNLRLHAALVWGGIALFLLAQAALIWRYLN